jgi:uncharacterized tellurite resistance protein B-like protein
MNEHVQAAFDELAAMTLDATHSSTQWQESRRFFFAGVLWAMVEADRRMDDVLVECEKFGKRVEAGEA